MKELLLRPTPGALNDDREFALAARMWTGDVVFQFGDDAVRLSLRDGRVTDIVACAPDAAASIRVAGPAEGWAMMLRPKPPPFYHDLFGATTHHGFIMHGAIEEIGPYYPALRRLIDLLRDAQAVAVA